MFVNSNPVHLSFCTKKVLCSFVLLCCLLATGCTRSASTGLNPGQVAPDFTLESLLEPDSEISLQSFRGKVVVLTFWASWCAPCLAEFTELKKLSQKFESDKLVIIAIGSDDSRGNLSAVAQREKLPFVLLYDSAGKVKTRYEVTGFPETSVIKVDGTLAFFPDPVSGPVVRIKGERPWASKPYTDILSTYIQETAS